MNLHWMQRALLLMAMIVSGFAAGAERTTYFVPDVAGSPVAAMDSRGDIIWRKSYKPYGEEQSTSPADVNLSYTGKPQDIDTALVYMGARWYDPVTGRFFSVDPQGFDQGNLQSFGRYSYANNSPYVFKDPDGEAAKEVFTDLMPQAGVSFAAIAAFSVGAVTEDPVLQGVAVDAMRNMQADGLNAILSVGAPPGSSKILKAAGSGRAKNKLEPDPRAEAPHSTRKVDENGKTTNYATYEVNPQNPSGFQETKRVDITGRAHRNPDGTIVPTPHVKEAGMKGVRPARQDELP